MCRFLQWPLELLYGLLERESVGIVSHGRIFRAGGRRLGIASEKVVESRLSPAKGIAQSWGDLPVL